MRPALLIGVCLCVAGLALAAPQLGTTEPPVSDPFVGDETPSEYGPVRGSYFRATSYDRYTGTAWERTADPEPLANLGPPPASADRIRVRYEVRAPVRTAPAPWRPTAYDGPEAVAVDGSIEPTAAYDAGEEFTVTARRPATTPSALRRAGTDYPDRLDRYRQLPPDTPSALDEVARTVTVDAETPYGTAVAVNRWLHTRKAYSPSVDRPDDHVATTFVTEMDAGFCQYFATAMVAMLRAEGVPARYVTGYTPYEQVGAVEHVIRGKYAHTWVEVYFPDVGWVAFDPTPSTPRRAQRGVATVDEGTNAAATAALRATVATATRQETEPGGWRQLDADVDVEGPVTAGANVTVTVRDPDDGTAIEGGQVRFNGRPVGETDDDGRVTAPVPYREVLTVAVYRYDGEGDPPPVVDAGSGPAALNGALQDLRYAAPRTEIVGSLDGLSDQVLFRATVERGSLDRPTADTSGDGDGSGAGLRWQPRRATRTATQGSERTFGVNTTIDVTVSPASGGAGARQPGERLTVRATIGGRPVPDATVTAGERTATTDDHGTATIPAPYQRPAVVTVERGDARGEASITVRGELDVAAGEADVAGDPVRVTATLDDGRPVPNATVTNGVDTTTTDADGVATVPAPYEPPWTIAVRRGDFRDSVSVPVRTGTGTVDIDRAVPGSDRALRATFGDVPIRNATVTVDGERVGTTDGTGRAAVAVPYAESVTYTVRRGRVTAERTVDVRTDATLSTDGPALPGGRVSLRATVADEPLPGATVRLDGRTVGETTANGEATVRVPVLAPTAELRVRRGAVTATTDLGTVSVVWALALAGLAGTVVLARRRGLLDGDRRDPRALARALRRDPWWLVGRLRDRLLATIAWLRESAAETVTERDVGAASPEPDAGASDPTGPPPPPDAPANENEIYRAWATFTSGLDADHESPATVAERAVTDGLPEAAVADLTRTFQAVRYGGADATPERERRAREALDRIREAAR